MKTILGRVTKKDQLNSDRKIRRESDIANGNMINYHRVHNSKKTYNRKSINKKSY